MAPRALAVFLFALSLAAQDKPLTTFPYTPGLDVPSMDRTADPCVDFYRYSCGGWIKNNPIPSDQARWDVYSKLDNDNKQFLWGLLQQASEGGAKRSANQQKIGDLFGACMDESAVERAGDAPLKPALAAIAALTSVQGLGPLLGREHLAAAGSGLLFGFGSDQDFSDSNRVIAFATAGGLGLPDRDYYTKTDAKSEEIRQKYVEHVAAMLALLGDTPEKAKAGALRIMDIETELAKASLTRVEQRDPHNLFHKMTPKQLQALAPTFPWTRYFQAAGLTGVTELNVTEPKFFQEMERQINSRDLDSLKTYLRWHEVNARSPYLSQRFAKPHFDFYSTYLRGVKEQAPRWKRCVRWTDEYLGEALGQVFVEKTFGPDVKQRTVTMTKQIEEAMQGEIEQLPWMSAATKKQALLKLHAVVNKIGYPDKWRDYSSVRIEPGDFAGDVERATVFESKRELGKIGKPVDRGEWGMTPPTVNAYYNGQMNDINFPAGVLQPPLYDARMDDAPNYGNTGATIGHELTHGFDDEGRQFDAKGNLKDWWSAGDADEFEKRVACVRDQYGNYTAVDDIKINSKLTLGEDVADLGGTLLGYIAWKKAVAGQELKPIDGFTPDQRFFIGMAQWACGDERPESKRAHALTDPHSPDQYRINGVVSNMPEFAAAFSCRAGQPMVREKSCRVW
jgi:putative endopeptidase